MEIKETRLFEITSLQSLVKYDLEKEAGGEVVGVLEPSFVTDFVEYGIDKVLFGTSQMDYGDEPTPEENLVSLGIVPVKAQELLQKWEEHTREKLAYNGVATNVKHEIRTFDYKLEIYQAGFINLTVEATTVLEEGGATDI